tara:strand:+ start:245 stop:433 length:189 start_codon:yes stop_codon:yes gene_type:complete
MMSKAIIITETRTEQVKYFYEFKGTIKQAQKWFENNGNYYDSSTEQEIINSEIDTVDYKEQD